MIESTNSSSVDAATSGVMSIGLDSMNSLTPSTKLMTPIAMAGGASGAATASLFPSLTLSASYGRGGFDWSTFTSPAGAIWSVGANLTQPLFHGGALVARKHQYEALYDAAVAQYKQTVLSAFQNVADTLVSLDEDANTLVQAQRAAAAAQAPTATPSRATGWGRHLFSRH